MIPSRRMLQHFLAALAYRTQKALRGAPDGFAEFSAGGNVRTPKELVWHMTGVIGYARTMLHGGAFQPPLTRRVDHPHWSAKGRARASGARRRGARSLVSG